MWSKNCSHQFLSHCTVGISGRLNFHMLSQFSREPRELPWQPNSEKYKPKLHKFLFLAKKIEEFFACSVGFYGLREFKFSRELRKLPWQPHLGKMRPAKIAQISIPCKKSRNFKHVNTGLLNSNMLPEFSTEPIESPWQPNVRTLPPSLWSDRM